MKQKTSEAIQHGLIVAAMVLPPWNIFWWTVGAVAYTVSGGRKWDTSGDGALGLVLGAPVTLPALPFMMIKERLELRAYNKKQARAKAAADRIAGLLKAAGIAVASAESCLDGAAVRARVSPAQAAAYGEAFAAAIREYPDLTPDEICGRADPLFPLDRAWAERCGIGVWAEEIFTRPCVDCGKVESLGWRFGAMAKYCLEHERGRRPVVHFAGGQREIDGHICRSCLDAMHWTSMSG